METIIKESWNYHLDKENNQYRLSVLYGSAALYEREIVLTPKQVIQYEKEGKSYIENLVKMIRANPNESSIF